MKRTSGKGWAFSGWLSASVMLGSLALVVAVLYWSREVMIPVALAILLTFILAPVVNMLRRCGLGRTASVSITVVLTFALLAGAGTMMVGELKSLADELPAYRQNIRQKIADLRVWSKSSTLIKVQETVKDAVAEFHKEDGVNTNKAAVPVVVTGDKTMASDRSLMAVVGPLLGPLASAGLVIVLVIFMLLRREDLRDRLLRLAGYGRLTATTKAIDEAGQRVSRYLFRQCLINIGFGLAVGVGLSLIGLRYAVLWGFLAGVARFIPYFGPWLGALSPALVSLAVFSGWTGPLLVIGLVALLELITNLAVEPVLYGQGIGVSEVSLLVMMAFWTWLWGPIGLILATPLTVCLMVISKSVPDLAFIGILLGNQPALAPHYAFYQRLVARDQDDANQIVEAFLKNHSRPELYEKILLPALIAGRQDFERGRLMEEDQAFVFQAVRQFLRDTQDSTLAPTVVSNHGSTAAETDHSIFSDRMLIFGLPAKDEGDELALIMLGQMLPVREGRLRILSSELFSSESLAEVEKAKPVLLCVGMLPGSELFPVRQLCKRLRARFPELPIVIGHWAGTKQEKIEEQFAGLTDAIGWTLPESLNQVLQFGRTSPAVRRIQSERLRIRTEGLAVVEHVALPEPP